MVAEQMVGADWMVKQERATQEVPALYLILFQRPSVSPLPELSAGPVVVPGFLP